MPRAFESDEGRTVRVRRQERARHDRCELGQRRDLRLTHELELRVGRLQPQRRRVGTVVGGKRISGPVGLDQRCDVAKLGIDDRPLERALQALSLAVQLNRQSQEQEKKRMQENADAP